MNSTRQLSVPGHAQFLWFVGRLVWKHLTLLVGMGIIWAGSLLPAAALVFLGAPVFSPLAALLAGSVWAGIIATTDDMVRLQEASLSRFIHHILAHARVGLMVSLVPALVATAFLGTLTIWIANPRQVWLLMPLVINGCIATTILLALPAVFSLATGSSLRGRDLWRSALGLVASRPSTVLGLLALGLVLWLLMDISGGPGLLLFIPAPLAVYLSAATHAAVTTLRDRRRDAAREPFQVLDSTPLLQE